VRTKQYRDVPISGATLGCDPRIGEPLYWTCRRSWTPHHHPCWIKDARRSTNCEETL